MGLRRGYPRRQPQLQAQLPQPRPPLISKTEGSDETSLCLMAATCTLASSVANFQAILRDDGTNREYKLITGTMEVAICYPYIFLKLHEFVPNLLPTPAALAPFKSWIAYSPNVRVFRDTAVLVVISCLLLLDINPSFVWLAIFPVIAIVFIRALYMNLYCGTVASRKDTARSNVDDDEKTIKKTVELEFIVMFTIGALLMMDQLPGDAAEGFPISQFLLFLSSTVAALTRMMMKLPADASPGIAPASELLHKTLLLLLLVTAHMVAAEWLGEDVVLVCLPEVVPVLLWFSLHLDGKPGSSSVISVDKMKPLGKDITSSIINVNKMKKPHGRDIIDVNKMKPPHGKDMSSVISIDKKMKPHKKDIGSIISVDKMRPHRKRLIALGAVVAALLAYLASSMDESGLSWCTTIMVSCGVSGILTYYLVFMLRHWSCPGQQAAADSSKDDVPSSGMLKLWADALLIAAAALLLLRYLVSLRLGLQQPLQVGKVVHSAEILKDYVSNLLGFNYSK